MTSELVDRRCALCNTEVGWQQSTKKSQFELGGNWVWNDIPPPQIWLVMYDDGMEVVTVSHQDSRGSSLVKICPQCCEKIFESGIKAMALKLKGTDKENNDE